VAGRGPDKTAGNHAKRGFARSVVHRSDEPRGLLPFNLFSLKRTTVKEREPNYGLRDLGQVGSIVNWMPSEPPRPFFDVNGSVNLRRGLGASKIGSFGPTAQRFPS
jgi:hypothetical protein